MLSPNVGRKAKIVPEPSPKKTVIAMWRWNTSSSIVRVEAQSGTVGDEERGEAEALPGTHQREGGGGGGEEREPRRQHHEHTAQDHEGPATDRVDPGADQRLAENAHPAVERHDDPDRHLRAPEL